MTQPPVDYQSNSTEKPKESGSLGAPQPVFDTVFGPNLRLKDNLFQLICCGVGVAIGALIGAILGFLSVANLNTLGGAIIGAFGGLVLGIFFSGIYVGVHRFIHAFKKR